MAHEEEWEQEIGFTLEETGLNRKVEFWLYKNDEAELYYEKPLYFYIDVKL